MGILGRDLGIWEGFGAEQWIWDGEGILGWEEDFGLEGEDVAAAVLSCASGIKFIGFCFSAGSDRRLVRDSVFSCLEWCECKPDTASAVAAKTFLFPSALLTKMFSFFPFVLRFVLYLFFSISLSKIKIEGCWRRDVYFAALFSYGND